MVRPLVKFGDHRLQSRARDVDGITPQIAALVGDMVETMHRAPGIGLAAPQVGVPLRVFVADLSAGRDPRALITMINPTIVQSEGMQLEEEGCLSLPGFTATVLRPSRVVVRGLTTDGEARVIEATGLLARAFQHEMDHLDGRLFIDRLRRIQRSFIVRRIRQLSARGQW